jgi:Leucine-rich repeat (LRR) protein
LKNWFESLNKLTHLNLSETEFNGIADFPRNLTVLDVSNNPNIYELTEIPNSLTYLDIGGTNINDISFVSNLTHLMFLDASATRITNVPVLPKSLEILKLSMNIIRDISECRNLSSLKTLEIDNTNVSNIKVLHHLNITSLKLNKSLVSSYDISMLLRNRKIETDVKVHNFRERK